LSGDQQVPPVSTAAQGAAVFWQSPDGKQLHYYLLVANLKNATMAHIHLGKAGQNGVVVLPLFHSMTPISTTGVLATGTVTASQLEGPLAGHPLSDLLAKMAAGGTYVNVDTTQHPDGEIRGQTTLVG
jgi:CHRD domain